MSPSNFHPEDGTVDMSPERPDVTKVIIIDAMCVVNMVVKTPEMTTAKHFASKFLQIIGSMSANYDEIRIVFDQ